ncbi:NAD-dependent epimerase/dehydratase family protein [Gemmatimonadota bacterium]
MTVVLVTGAAGFIGSNLSVALARRNDVEVIEIDRDHSDDDLRRGLARADAVFHLAGVNRPDRVEDYETENVGFTRTVLGHLTSLARKPLFVLASSTQAELENPYGRSKLQAEEAVRAFGRATGSPCCVFRLPGVFGKWCRPNYNSAVATFCYNLARDLPITISDPDHDIELVYIDDVVDALSGLLDGREKGDVDNFYSVASQYRVSLGELAATLRQFAESRQTLQLPDFSDDLVRKLFSTYLSYLPPDSFSYSLQQRSDPRGVLAEFLKSPHLGQVFVSRTGPGITRGNHYHDSKVEKFLVLEGKANIQFRDIRGGEVLEYLIEGAELRVVDIPPGHSHSIENVGSTEMIVLFWANEVLDFDNPDTHHCGV